MSKRSPFRVFLAVVVMECLFLSACGGPSSFTSATETPIPTCMAPTTIPYTTHTIDKVVGFYSDYLNSITNNPSSLENMRKEAFLRLVKNADHWSSTRNLPRDNTRMVRVTITLLDPSLVQYVILNQFLYNISSKNLVIATTDPQYGTEAFRTRLQNVMQELAMRQELLFLVTITSPNYDSQAFDAKLLPVNIPFSELFLINASNTKIKPTHDDHNLSEPVEISNGHVSGLVGYPLTQMQAGGCAPLLDMWNTTLTLEVAHASVGGNTFEKISWTIPFDPLIDDDFNYYGDNFHYIDQYAGVFPSSIVRTPAPPTPTWNTGITTDSTNWNQYWLEMSQYIWYVLVTDNLH